MNMDVDHPERDQRWDYRRRRETELERLDRNWTSLLQELRVVQTGVQLLTGFLLMLPFQQRFEVLGLHTVYLATVAFSVGATILLVAPRWACTGYCSGDTVLWCWFRRHIAAPMPGWSCWGWL